MTSSRRLYAVFLVLLTCVLAGFGARAAADEPPATSLPHHFTFGVVPQFEQRKLFAIWRPILDEIERRTGFVITLTGSPRIRDFEKDFANGAFDFAYMNPYHVVQSGYNHSNSYLPILRDGGHVLQGIIVVYKDSPLQSISDLKDTEMVFPSPNSLGATLLIRSELKRRYGIEVIPKYVQTHSSVYLFVAKNLAQAGGGVASTLSLERDEVKNRLRVLYQTPPIPPHPITAHRRVAPEHRDAVMRAFLEFAQTAEGQRALRQVPIDELISTSLIDYRSLSSLDFRGYRVE